MANQNGTGSFRNSFSRLFLGADVKNPEREAEQKIINKQTLVAVENDDASDLVDISHHASAGYMSGFDLRDQAEIINEYRAMVVHAEVDKAVDDIINEAVTSDADISPVIVKIKDNDRISDETKIKIEKEFQSILKLLKFNARSYEIFKQYFVDGRLFYHKIIDESNKSKGILKLVNLDPRAAKKVKEIQTEIDPQSRIEKIVDTRSYFLYDTTYSSMSSQGGVNTHSISRMTQALELNVDSVAFVHSGIVAGEANNLVLGHLEKVRKPLNNLRMLEDAAVIYRITRAPERRIFYVDIGNLPKKGAEEYMMSLINKYKTKLVYDGSTGKVKGNSHQVSMMEDYWLPRREGGKGTEITTLPAGQNLNQIDDIKYFKKNLLEALNVPKSRMESEATISIGNRATEINRDEIKFNKFIQRLRRRFNGLFLDLLRTQLILKNITSAQDWDDFVLDLISFEYASDTFIKEEQEAQVMEGRLAALDQADPYVGKYFSRKKVMKVILRMTDEEIEQEDKNIADEVKAGHYETPEDQRDMDAGIHDDQIDAHIKVAKAAKPLTPRPKGSKE
jgi:Bacteriophage T4-like portal protein (Gp20)